MFAFYFLSFVLLFVLLSLSLYACCALLVLLHCLFFSALSLCFLFPLRYIRKKKGRSVLVRPLLSCCGIVGLVGVRFPVLVKFVIVNINLFGDTFIGYGIFVIVLPLLKKTFENTINKFPCIKMLFYTLIYVI